MKDKIDFSEFLEIEKKLEIKVGKILFVEAVPKSEKLIKLEVDFGDLPDGGRDTRIVVTNIKQHIGDTQECIDVLTGLSFPFVTNLKPVKMMGVESHAMIMPGEIEKRGLVFSVNGSSGINIL